MANKIVLAKTLPLALDGLSEFVSNAQHSGQQVVFFLDFDGTLSPIVPNPEDARLPERTAVVLNKLSRDYRTTIVTGRSLETVKVFTAGIENLSFAGSHGFDIDALPLVKETIGSEHRPTLEQAKAEIGQLLQDIKEAKIEDNLLSVSVHYRHVKQEQHELVRDVVKQTCNKLGLKVHLGKYVWEIRPEIKWNKGYAVEYLINKMVGQGKSNLLPIYIGDDTTDEDAFEVLPQFDGIGVVVFDPDAPPKAGEEGPKKTRASHRVRNPHEVCDFLNAFVVKDRLPKNTIQDFQYSNMLNDGGTQSQA